MGKTETAAQHHQVRVVANPPPPPPLKFPYLQPLTTQTIAEKHTHPTPLKAEQKKTKKQQRRSFA